MRAKISIGNRGFFSGSKAASRRSLKTYLIKRMPAARHNNARLSRRMHPVAPFPGLSRGRERNCRPPAAAGCLGSAVPGPGLEEISALHEIVRIGGVPECHPVRLK